MMKIKSFCGGFDRNLCYVVYDEDVGIIIDPFKDNRIIEFCDDKSIQIEGILITHDHFDHCSGISMIKNKFGAKVYAHHSARIKKDIRIKNEKLITIGKIKIKPLLTPGHSKSAICYFIGQNLFTGDTLFVGNVGGTGIFFRGSDANELKRSLSRIMDLDGNIRIYPGHNYGKTLTSTINNEKNNNPYLKELKKFNAIRYLKRKIKKI